MAIREDTLGTPGSAVRALDAEEVLALQNEILRLVAVGERLELVLDRLVRRMEERSGRALCSILLYDERGSRLLLGAAPSLPEGYNRAIHGLVADATTGSCGAAIHRRETVVVEDIAASPLWTKWAALAREHGLAACASTPILDSRGRPIGTYALYYGEPGAPSAVDRDLVEISRDLAAVAIERSRQEEALVALNSELESRVRERTDDLEAFTFSVSHDLRAPLRAIEARLGMLIEDAAPRDALRGLDHVDAALRSARHMNALIDDLLDLSHTTQKPLRKAWVDAGEVVASALDTLRSEMEGREVTVDTGTLPACLADRGLLLQVFVNLLSNALKYSRSRAPARIEIRGRNLGLEVEYSVRDNGIGFDMRHKDRIFEVFHRLHGVEEYEGSGIGLALVARIVGRHGGRVAAEGSPGAGARFSFAIPSLHAE